MSITIMIAINSNKLCGQVLSKIICEIFVSFGQQVNNKKKNNNNNLFNFDYKIEIKKKVN